MPNLPAHIDLAIAASSELRHPDIESHLAYFYLGATAPDIRALTKRARSEYHFVDLDFETIGTGVQAMFSAYPELMNAAEHDGPTRAFIAGYITHLLADESYIVRMFRPFFGDGGVFEDDDRAKVWDRALQLDFDREVWDHVRRSVGQLDVDPANISVRFLPQEDLVLWKEWVTRVVGTGFSWDRLKFMASRISAGDDRHPAHAQAELFISSVPDSLTALYDLVPRARVSEFKSDSLDTIVSGLRGYLS